jgi:hypothetical protein
MKKVTLFLLIFALTVGGVFLWRFLKADQAAPEEVAMKMYLTLERNGKGVDQR